MELLVVGSTGMLGQSLMVEARQRGAKVAGMARNGAELTADITDDGLIRKIICDLKPKVLINTAALTDLSECETRPERAYLINARAAGVLAECCRITGTYFIQVSTDHYYTGDGQTKHSETDPVRLVNEYARTKYAGEAFALTNRASLVVRTNIIGFRHNREKPTFVEWAIKTLRAGTDMTLFGDYFTSSVHVKQFSKILLDLLPHRPNGILNIASSEVSSKQRLIIGIANKLGYSLENCREGKVNNGGGIPRAESLGLDVTKAEFLIGGQMPSFEDVLQSIIDEYKETDCHEI